MKMIFYKLCLFIVLLKISSISCSIGDKSPFYNNCVNKCLVNSCEKDNYNYKPEASKKLILLIRLLWNCKDECRYNCMWPTVIAFQERGYAVPQFFGKWPFLRIYGIQEPASTLASLLNFAAHYYMLKYIRYKFPSKDTPMFVFWHSFALVCMNAWAWSAIFHTRDLSFTEYMDYSCAFSVVMIFFAAALVRISYYQTKLFTVCLIVPLVVFYYRHVIYISDMVDMDYSYNMALNILFGAAGSLAWVWWACWGAGRRGRGARWVCASVGLSAAALTLEVIDFPPLGFIMDSHALWHFSTAPITLVFYRFVILDIEDLLMEKRNMKNDLKLAEKIF